MAMPPVNAATEQMLREQLDELINNPMTNLSVGMEDDTNIFCWELLIIGQVNTLYEGGIFEAKIFFPADYPQQAPQIVFKTQMWHPNIDYWGNVYMVRIDQPGDYFVPPGQSADPVSSILSALLTLLQSPEIDNIGNVRAAYEYYHAHNNYIANVVRYVQKSIMPNYNHQY